METPRPPLCFVLTSLARTGGVERDALKAILRLAGKGRTIHITAGFVRPGVREALADLPVVWHPIRAPVRPPALSQLLIWLQARRVVARLRRRHPGLRVVGFEPNPLLDCWIGATPQALWRQAKRRAGLPPSLKPGISLWNGWAERRLSTRAEHIVVYSRQARAWFVRHGVAEPRLSDVIIPCDTDRFHPTNPPIADRCELLIIGAHPRLKGIDIMLDAWREIAPRFPELRLRIVCKGWKVPALVRKAGLPRVETAPVIAEPEAYYARARLVVMPSLFESWGNVPLEALACGVPVVVSRQVPSSMVVTAPWQGAVIERAGGGDGARLAEAVAEQLLRTESEELMARRHRSVVEFVAAHETTLSWLERHA